MEACLLSILANVVGPTQFSCAPVESVERS
jgi:hypothetical protein